MYYFNIKLQKNLLFILMLLLFLFNNWPNNLSLNAAKININNRNLKPLFSSHIPRTFSNLKSKSLPIINRPKNTKNLAIVHSNFKGKNLFLSGNRKTSAQLRAPVPPMFIRKPPANIANIPLNLIFTPGAPGTG
ncbi:hypothetical protein Mgra_00006746 [Meloidogyne graminicola]|uniref:Uncharacterized protein n=1 Tax=Meloidogyne graminicola TaxID=189291 RepID=A0A8S9ZL79_9BILA|nr:hypothetical protein Mgra_00006746 [Meloidogyne graminicola]